MHFCVARGPTLRLDENEAIEFAGFAEAVGAVERSSRRSTIVSSIWTLSASFDASTYAVVGESHYAAMVREDSAGQ